MKIFKFFLVFILVTGAIFAMTVGLNWTAFKTVFSDPESFSEGSEWIEQTYSLSGLMDFMSENPQFVSAVSLNIYDESDVIEFNSVEPRVMGATSNIFLLLEYARQVNEGFISPNDLINITEIERFTVPAWYRSGHRSAMQNLPVENNQARLGDIIHLVSKHYSQAVSDWLFFHLGPERVNNLIYTLAGNSIEPWTPGAGILATILTRDSEISITDAVEFWKNQPVDERTNIYIENAYKYFNDDNFHAEVALRAGNIRDRLLIEERRIHGLWSRTEPLALTKVMASIFRGDAINEEVSNIVKEYMYWASEDPVIREHTKEYGAVFDSRLGYLIGIDFGTSVYTDKSYAQTLFFDDLPVAFWLHMSSNFMNHDLQRRFIYDPASRSRLEAISANSEREANELEL